MRRLHDLTRSVRAELAWRPEWPLAVLVAVAWMVLVLLDVNAVRHAAHTDPAASTSLTIAVRHVSHWAVMSFAMMIPVTLPAVRHVFLNSIPLRRPRAVAIYTGAYLAAWLLFGAVAAMLIRGASVAGISDRALMIVVMGVATFWQLTPAKRRAVIACRRTVPLPPHRLRADAACVRFAALQAKRCTLACWPLMLLMAVTPTSLALMIVVTCLVVVEERASRRGTLIRPLAAAFASATLIMTLAP